MVTPLKAPARGRQKGDDDLDILLESESETEDQAFLDQENESISYFTCEIWKEFAGREFDLVLGKTCRSSDNMRLNAKASPLPVLLFRSLALDHFLSKFINFAGFH